MPQVYQWFLGLLGLLGLLDPILGAVSAATEDDGSGETVPAIDPNG